MRSRKFSGLSGFRGTIRVPGDKSIAHRSVIVSALSATACSITNFPTNDDCLRTIDIFKRLGIPVTGDAGRKDPATIVVRGKGLFGLRPSAHPLHAGESGTSFRLMLGILSGQRFSTVLSAGPMLSRRPMSRVTVPLRLMGASLTARVRDGSARTRRGSGREEYPPVTVHGSFLKPITYRLPLASAQVKSAILLAGLYAQGSTTVIEPVKTRDHTERLLALFNADIKVHGNTAVIRGGRELSAPRRFRIPGDISSASFFMILGLLAQDSRILIKDVSLNPTRTGVLRVLKRMGANIKVTRSPGHQVTRGEPRGDIEVTTSRLQATTVTGKEIPSLIDELPILMVAACYARGRSVFQAVEELRVKETDRIASMVKNLKRMGATIKVTRHKGQGTRKENIEIQGGRCLKGAKVESFQDHRTAMSLIVAGLCAQGQTVIDDTTCISKSFPGFLKTLSSLTAK